MNAANGRLVVGVVERLYSELLLDVRFKPADQRSSSIRPVIWVVSVRADARDVVVDGMLRRTAWKSVRYVGELVVPDPLDAVRRHLPF